MNAAHRQQALDLAIAAMKRYTSASRACGDPIDAGDRCALLTGGAMPPDVARP